MCQQPQPHYVHFGFGCLHVQSRISIDPGAQCVACNAVLLLSLCERKCSCRGQRAGLSAGKPQRHCTPSRAMRASSPCPWPASYLRQLDELEAAVLEHRGLEQEAPVEEGPLAGLELPPVHPSRTGLVPPAVAVAVAAAATVPATAAAVPAGPSAVLAAAGAAGGRRGRVLAFDGRKPVAGDRSRQQAARWVGALAEPWWGYQLPLRCCGLIVNRCVCPRPQLFFLPSCKLSNRLEIKVHCYFLRRHGLMNPQATPLTEAAGCIDCGVGRRHFFAEHVLQASTLNTRKRSLEDVPAEDDLQPPERPVHSLLQLLPLLLWAQMSAVCQVTTAIHLTRNTRKQSGTHMGPAHLQSAGI